MKGEKGEIVGPGRRRRPGPLGWEDFKVGAAGANRVFAPNAVLQFSSVYYNDEQQYWTSTVGSERLCAVCDQRGAVNYSFSTARKQGVHATQFSHKSMHKNSEAHTTAR